MAFIFTGAHADNEGQANTHPLVPANQQDWLRGMPAEPAEAWMVALGGRLYDDWARTQFKDLPRSTHPAYPRDGGQQGGATWRCMECHGWDRDGAPETGMPGLRAIRSGITPERLRDVLRGDTHRYAPRMIPDTLVAPLALFLSRGQVETEKFVDPATARVLGGDVGHGRAVFQNICAVCHGFDGKAINSGSAQSPRYVGTVARQTPWELIHKMLNGQPGQAMPVMRGLGDTAIQDMLAFAQTLPAR